MKFVSREKAFSCEMLAPTVSATASGDEALLKRYGALPAQRVRTLRAARYLPPKSASCYQLLISLVRCRAMPNISPRAAMRGYWRVSRRQCYRRGALMSVNNVSHCPTLVRGADFRTMNKERFHARSTDIFIYAPAHADIESYLCV